MGAEGDSVAKVTASLSTTLPTGVPGQYSSYAPVTVVGVPGVEVVVDVGVVVVVVAPEPLVVVIAHGIVVGAPGQVTPVVVVVPIDVVVGDPEAAITGAIGDAVGAVVVIPDGVTLSLG